MRTLGNVLSLLAVACLIIGAATAILLYSSAVRMFTKAKEMQSIISDDIDEVRDIFDDVENVFEETQGVVEDYESGRITDVNDERVAAAFRQINEALESTRSIKQKAEEDIKIVEQHIEDLMREGLGLVPMAITSIVTLIISGWLFGFGVSFRSAAK